MNYNKKDIEPYNDKNQPHGLWECYWTNGNISFKCYYVNGDEVGYDEDYNGMGRINSKSFYLR